MIVGDWALPINLSLGGFVLLLLWAVFTGRLVVKSTMTDRLADKQETIQELKLTVTELRKQLELHVPTMDLIQRFIKAIPGVEEVKAHVVEQPQDQSRVGSGKGSRRTAVGGGTDGEN